MSSTKTGLLRVVRLGVIGAIAVACVSPLAAVASAQEAPTADDAAAMVSGDVQRSAEDVEAYWTPERLAEAQPADTPDPFGGPELRSEVPKSVLPAESGDGYLPEAVETATDAESDRLAGARGARWFRHGQMPATSIGKLYFTENGGGGYCTASVINADNHSLVWTAGHCVHGGKGKNWNTNFMFKPDYDDGGHELGTWVGKQPGAPRGWTRDGDLSYDMGAVVVWPNAKGKVADVAGYQGYTFNGSYNNHVHSFGYPQDGSKPRPDMNGERLFYCDGNTSRVGFWPFLQNKMTLACDMGHGASGGPWLNDLQLGRGWGYIVGVQSTQQFGTDGNTRSAYEGDAAINLRNALKN